MQQIFNFLIRNKNNILFLLLLGLSLFLTIQSHSFHKSKFISSANFVTGGIYKKANSIQSYFYLEEYNELLLQENNLLRNKLSNIPDTIFERTFIDSTIYEGVYQFRTARVINNNFAKVDNYITLDKGKKDNIIQESGVVTSQGIVGIIDNVSRNYSRVISILNSDSKINAQLQKTNHFGSLIWNGKDPNVVQLIDVPRLAPIKKGDTIITGGKSLIFPRGIPIGNIVDFHLDENGSYYTIDIKLFNDMTNIGHVYVIVNKDKEEIKSLEAIDD